MMLILPLYHPRRGILARVSNRVYHSFRTPINEDTLMNQKIEITMHATVCFPRRGNEILLAWKEWRENRKNIGAERWNGYGGKIEEGESARETAARELSEESGLDVLPKDLEKIAIVNFYNTKDDGSVGIIRVHMYTVSAWEGEAQVVDEMTNPTWFNIDKLPFDEMMPADKIWLPVALSGKKIFAEAHYGPFQKELLKPVVIREVDEFYEVN